MRKKPKKTAESPPSEKVPGKGRFFWWFLAFLPFACLVLAIVGYGVDIPYIDQWDQVPLLKKTFEGAFPFRDLWLPHNEHRIVFPQLIIIALAHLSFWNMYYEMAMTVIFASAFFFVLIFLFKRSMRSIGGGEAGWAVPIVSLIVFSLSQWESWSMGGQLAVFLGILAFSAAVAFLLTPVFRRRDFIFAGLSAVVSTFSFANGLLVWPIGLFVLFCKDKKRLNPSTVSWLLLSVIIVLAYFYGYSAQPGGPSAGNVFSQPGEYAEYVFKFLGGPLNNIGAAAAFSAGLAGAALFLSLIFILVRIKKIDFQVLLPYLALGFYSLGCAVISGAGRIGFGSDYALVSRYITFSSPLWISNVVFLAFFISGKQGSKAGKTISISILLAVVLLLLSNLRYGELFFNTRYVYLATARDEIFSEKNEDFLHLLHPSAAVVKEGLASLERYRLSVYRETGEPERRISEEERFERLKSRFGSGLRLNPYLDEVCARLGMIYLKRGSLKEGEFLWKKALEINPDYAAGYRNLILYYLYRGNTGEARVYAGKMRDRGLPVDPEILKAVENKGAP